jgi:peptidyl-prolyl cis-trans isomerase SurA
MAPIRPCLILTALLASLPAAAQPHRARPGAAPAPQAIAAQGAATPAPASTAGQERIIAVVNGDIITTGDVINRGRLFALSTGLPITPEVLERLRPQVARQLVDERLRLQEVQRRKIAVSDREIAEAIGDIEQRNGMPKGALSASLNGRGVALRTLIDQVRVQIGWTRVLRQELGARADISDADVAEQIRLFKEQIGKPEYQVREIFIPIEDPSRRPDAQRFADTVIAQLRAGAPFPVVAAQFSQSQTALQGGDLGWVRANQLDPEVAAVVTQMPAGAVSNPIAVPGGITIVSLGAKRDIGREESTVMHIRQVFIPFPTPLNPGAPTPQQRAAVEQATAVSKSVRTCTDMEAANTKAGATRPSDPGELRLEGVSSAPLRALLSGMAPNTPSKPVVASEGVAVLMVCSRETKTAAEPSKQEITSRLLGERIELASRQLQRDLRRRAVMEERS